MAANCPAARGDHSGVGQRGTPHPADFTERRSQSNVHNQFLTIINENKRLQGQVKQINALLEQQRQKLAEPKSHSKEADLGAKLQRELEEAENRYKAELEDYKSQLVEATLNYENAKVVVLTYKTKNIHLESAVQDLESKLVELEDLRKKLTDAEERLLHSTKVDFKNTELTQRLHHAEDRANIAEQEIVELRQLLHTRSQEVNQLNIVMQNIAQSCRVSSDQLQWMMGDAWKQQQQSEQSLLQQFDQLRADLHDKDRLISQLNLCNSELKHKVTEVETFSRIKQKNFSTEKIESQAAKLESAVMHIEQLKRDTLVKEEEIKKKDTAIKGLQEILKQSHQEKHQTKVNDLTRLNETLRKKCTELREKCEQAETEYAIIKSVDLQSRQDMQQYKEQVISLERDLRKCKQTEKDMYKELDEALRDLENVSNRYQAVQKENTELKRGQQVPVSQMGDSQLVQELNFKNRQMEILHAEIKKYADNFDTERRRVAMLSAENQRYQHQIQHIKSQALLSPHSPNFPSIRTQPQPFGNVHNQWEGMQSPSPTVLSRDTASNQPLPNHSAIESNYHLNEPYRQGYDTNAGRRDAYPFNMPKTYPPDRTRTTPRFDEPHTGQPVEPCPLCGKTFSTTELLMAHAASCL